MKRSGIFFLLLLSTSVWAQIAVIRSGALKVYEAPDEASGKIMTLGEGDTVKVVEHQGKWLKLQLPGRRFGWIRVAESTSEALLKKSHRMQQANMARSQDLNSTASASVATGTTPESAFVNNVSEQSQRNLPASASQIQNELRLSKHMTDLNLGISFTLGAICENFAYSGRFLYRTLPSVYLEGAFEHVPGDVATSLLVHSNLLYNFSLTAHWDGWITGGVGVISTSPTKTVGAKSVSNMELNYGIGVRRYLKHRTYLRADLRRFSVLLEKSTKHYVEFAVGIIIGVR